ncbi:hypothetical protein SAMN05518871_109132 [Psychrobacillus sp. OK028]|uniref:hypothetical protein n=1 Tax=Psychrobacillus sp. OK028 TaxID=1884359 RepID=UPI00088E3A63|nr:hypothetical protein [Psychrobacillus sp. OK028]SDO02341.1 hypothetical protein SAMN05518871_109132 [Psychrobacillus sp. OK028]
MNNNYAINKSEIDNFLEDNISKYLDTLIKSFEGNNYNHFQSSDIKSDSIRALLIGIRKILHTEEIEQIKTRVTFQENKIDIKDAIKNLDLNDVPKFEKEIDNERIVIGYVLRLIVSRLLLQVNILISTIRENEVNDRYDVFLSHCSWDAKEVLGLKLMLEDQNNLKVYVDWIDDKQANYPRAIQKIIEVIYDVLGFQLIFLDNDIDNELRKIEIKSNNSEQHISNLILKRLTISDSLMYVQSRHYDHSRWMPWELGIAEAQDMKIFRIPIKYIRKRPDFGKYSGFLIRYNSIIDAIGRVKSI